MRSADVAVVGAGPAGISAAFAAAESGAQTLLIDENPAIGGQLRWRLTPTLNDHTGLGIEKVPGPEAARNLADRAASAANLTVLTSTVAWGLFEDLVLGISSDDGADEIQASAIVLATGSTDVAAPFPGWTLPGVLTARAVQIFMHIHRVRPAHQWAILGDTPDAEELAADIERAGGEVTARFADPEQLRASGTNRLAHVEHGDQVHEVDGLAIALGRQPDAELALQAMADARFDWNLGGYTPLRTESGETSVPGVYIAGDAAGIGSIEELVADGRLAGLSAAGATGKRIDDARAAQQNASSKRRKDAIARLQIEVTERAG